MVDDMDDMDDMDGGQVKTLSVSSILSIPSTRSRPIPPWRAAESGGKGRVASLPASGYTSVK
jgi:hypothetical protein